MKNCKRHGHQEGFIWNWWSGGQDQVLKFYWLHGSLVSFGTLFDIKDRKSNVNKANIEKKMVCFWCRTIMVVLRVTVHSGILTTMGILQLTFKSEIYFSKFNLWAMFATNILYSILSFNYFSRTAKLCFNLCWFVCHMKQGTFWNILDSLFHD